MCVRYSSRVSTCMTALTFQYRPIRELTVPTKSYHTKALILQKNYTVCPDAYPPSSSSSICSPSGDTCPPNVDGASLAGRFAPAGLQANELDVVTTDPWIRHRHNLELPHIRTSSTYRLSSMRPSFNGLITFLGCGDVFAELGLGVSCLHTETTVG